MIDWLNTRQTLGIRLGLDEIVTLLDLLGRPQDRYRSIHVAGSNGKGSVAAILAKALELSGYHTGLYTSPHLVEFSERIRVDGEAITSDDLSVVLGEIRSIVAELDETGSHPTFFEITTAAALTHFARRGVDWAVIEAGMGGRTDATNVIRAELAIITNVSLEHTDFLGTDIGSIAREKAGIIDPGVPIVTAATGEALDVIRNEAARRGSLLVSAGQDYLFQSSRGEMVLTGPERTMSFNPGMAGVHQVENAAVAVVSCEVLRGLGVAITDDAVEQAVRSTSLPGRLESFDDDGVNVIIDGAHNPAATKSLSDSLGERGRVFDLIVGFSSDKDWPTMLGYLTTLARRVWAVTTRSPRSLEPAEMAGHVPVGTSFETPGDFAAAYRQARAAGARDVLVTGSLFLAGEARAVLTGHDLTEIGGRQ